MMPRARVLVMAGALALVAAAAACGPANIGPRSPEDPGPQSVDAIAPHHVPGEEMGWEVFWRGVAIGRATMVVSPTGVRCSFRTGTLASALASVRYQSTTTVVHGEVRAADETIAIAGDHAQRAAQIDGMTYALQGGPPQQVPGGTRLHTVGSTVGVLRTWSQSTPRRGYLWLLHDGALYRLDVDAPVRDEALGRRALRIDGEIRALAGPSSFGISVWLAANAARTPLRFAVAAGEHRITAALIETNTAVDPRR